MKAVYETFDPVIHGGPEGDRPDGFCLYHFEVGKRHACGPYRRSKTWRVGHGFPFPWQSPSGREYTIFLPRGIVAFQRIIRRRIWTPHRLLHRQLTGNIGKIRNYAIPWISKRRTGHSLPPSRRCDHHHHYHHHLPT